MWVCRLPVHIDPAECTVLYGNLRRIRDFPWVDMGIAPSNLFETYSYTKDRRAASPVFYRMQSRERLCINLPS